MKSVLNNPYRILGLLVGATAAEQRKQITRLHRFIEAEQNPGEDFSFPLIGALDRTIDSINESASKLNLDADRLTAALFWFYQGSDIFDEPVFDALKNADLEVVKNIWEKKTLNEEMSLKNASAFFNLGTLYLSGIADGTKSDSYLIRTAIEFKLQFIENGYHRKLMMLSTDENFKMSKENLQLIFLDNVFVEIESAKRITTKQYIEIIKNIEFSAKSTYFKSFVSKPIEVIESKIAEAKTKKKNDISKSISIAQNLNNELDELWIQIKSILDVSDIKYSSLSDRYADFLLQCGIDYFRHYMDSDSMNELAASKASELFTKAEHYAIGNIVKERILDSRNSLKKLKDKEITQALELLKSIKEIYESNKIKITDQALSMPLGYNQTINWTKVDEMIEKSLDWNKVVELVLETIPMKNMEKIKNFHNDNTLYEFKTLMNFLWGKLNFSQKNKIKYICYWKTENTISKIETTADSMPLWVKWTLGILVVLFIIYLIWGVEGLGNVFAFAVIIGFIALIQKR
jgi:hypothetical protein